MTEFRRRLQYSPVLDPRDDGCCSVNLVKAVFSIFNLIYVLSGVCLLGVGLWTLLSHRWHLRLMSTPTLALVVWLSVAAGVVVLVSAVLGCAAARRENKWLIGIYTFLLLVVLVCECLLGLVSYVYYEQVGHDLSANLKNVFVRDYSVQSDVTQAVDYIQQKLSCCGSSLFSDWRTSDWFTSASKKNLVPDSCCKTMTFECGRRDHPSNISYTGCLHGLQQEIKSRLLILGAVGVSLAALSLVGLFYAAGLFRKVSAFQRYLRRKQNADRAAALAVAQVVTTAKEEATRPIFKMPKQSTV